jgi:type II secretory pathway component GspD/PulD (secretin)
MATNRDRSTACLLALTSVLLGASATHAIGGGALASAAGGTGSVEDVFSADRVIGRVADLIVEEKLVRARALLDELVAGSGLLSLSDGESRRVFELMGEVERRMRRADPMELSLQRAELALVGDDLVSAERHATAVRGSAALKDGQKARAEMILSMVSARRDMLRPTVGASLSRALEAFESGAYESAKGDLERVDRSGIELTAAQRRSLEGALARLRSMESDRGEAFDDRVALLSLMQPAVANKTGWSQQAQPASSPPAAGQPAPAEDMITTARRLEAQSLLAEADRAWASARYAEAQRLYTQALEVGRGLLTEEQSTQASSRATEAAVILRGNLPAGGALQDDIDSRRLARQQVEAEFANAMEQARGSMATGDMGRARDAASTAKLALSQGRDLFDIATYEQRLTEAERLLAEIGDAEERQRIGELERAQRDAAQRASDERASKAREVDEKITRLIESVRAHQSEQNYEKALQEVDQILFLDPLNPAGLLLRDVLTDTMLLIKYQHVSAERRPSYVYQGLDNWEATVAPRNIINYPSDWKNISQRRGDPMQFSESAANRAVLAALEDKRIPVDFRDNNIEDVLTFIANVGNVDMDVDWPSLEDIGVARETPVTLRLTSVPLQTVLDRVLGKASDPSLPAGWAVTDGVLTVASDEVLRRNTVLEIYDIRDLLIEIPDYDNAPEFDLNTVFQVGGQQGGGGGGGQSPFQQQGTDIDRRDRQEMVQDIVDLIQNNVDRDGWVDFGGDTGSITEINGNLIIVNTPKNHRAVTGLLSKLRAVRNLQINVESRFLLINEDYFEQIGVDLDVYFSNNNEFDILRSFDPSLLPSDFFSRTAEGNLILNRNVTGGGYDRNGDGVITDDERINQTVFQPGAQGDQFSPLQGAQNSLGLTRGLTQGSFASDVLSLISPGGPALSFAGRFLDDIQVDFLVEATQADRSSMSLTAPRLTITNGQLAYTFVGTQTSFVSDLQPVVSNSAVGLDPTVGVVPEGVRLVVRGVVSADRRYVTLDVTTDVAAATLTATTTVQAAAGGTGNIPGSGIATGTIQLPIVTITRVQTTVTVPDQGTVLLGGQRLVNEYVTETGVPVLSKIPILNRFFTNRVESKEEQTLLILIKPTILIQNEEEERNFPGLLDALGG